MADEPVTPSSPQTPDTPDDVRDAERFDAEQFPDVQSALTQASHLDPTTSPSEPMPEWAWDRIAQAIGIEAAARAAATHDNVVAFPGAAHDGADTDRAGIERTGTSGVPAEPRRFRWVGGLVAASVVILAITVGVQVTGGTSSSGDLVAGEAAVAVPSALAKAAAPGTADAPVAASAEAASSVEAQGFAAAPASPASSGGAASSGGPAAAAAPGLADQPAKVVMESNTQYTEAGLTGQVRTLLDRINVHSAREAQLMAPKPISWPVEDGFTANWTSLRDCLSWLANSSDVQALVVDRATFEGSEAGVIIVPADQVDPGVTPPPTASVESANGTMDVWVVDPACQQEVDSIMEHLPYFWPR
jgi:hypothetical protein